MAAYQGLFLSLLVVSSLGTNGGVSGNPVDHPDDEGNGETKEVMMALFNRQPFSPKSTSAAQPELIGFSACWEACKQSGGSLMDIHACSRACLLNTA